MGGSRRLLTAVAGAAALVFGTAGAGYGVYDAWQQEQREQRAAASAEGTADPGENRSRTSTTPGNAEQGGSEGRTPESRRTAEPQPDESSNSPDDADGNDASPERTQEATPDREETPEPEETDAGNENGPDDRPNGDSNDGGSDGSGDEESDQPEDEATAASSRRARFEAEVVRLTNARRQEHGCDELQSNDALTTAARGHSTDMAERDYFAHNSPEGETPWDRMREAGYHDPAAENIAMGHAEPAAVVRAWMDSPGHRENILNCSYESIGVGVHLGDGPYWTQNFGYE